MLGRATFDVDEEWNKLDWGFEEIKRVRMGEEYRKNRKMKVAKHFSGEGEDTWLLSFSHATLSEMVSCFYKEPSCLLNWRDGRR